MSVFSTVSVSAGVIRNPVYADVCIRTGKEEKFVMGYKSLAFDVVIDLDGIRRLPVWDIMARHFFSGLTNMFVILLYASAIRWGVRATDRSNLRSTVGMESTV